MKYCSAIKRSCKSYGMTTWIDAEVCYSPGEDYVEYKKLINKQKHNK